jgi:TIR domain
VSRDRPIRVFISYAREDSTAFVDRLEADLRQRNYVTWVDRSALEGGDKWEEEIQSALAHSDVVVLVISPKSVKSHWVGIECWFALKQHIPIIPIISKPVKRISSPLEHLHQLQQIDFSESYDEALTRLDASIRLQGPRIPVGAFARGLLALANGMVVAGIALLGVVIVVDYILGMSLHLVPLAIGDVLVVLAVALLTGNRRKWPLYRRGAISAGRRVAQGFLLTLTILAIHVAVIWAASLVFAGDATPLAGDVIALFPLTLTVFSLLAVANVRA